MRRQIYSLLAMFIPTLALAKGASVPRNDNASSSADSKTTSKSASSVQSFTVSFDIQEALEVSDEEESANLDLGDIRGLLHVVPMGKVASAQPNKYRDYSI